MNRVIDPAESIPQVLGHLNQYAGEPAARTLVFGTAIRSITQEQLESPSSRLNHVVPTEGNTPEEIAREVFAVNQIGALPTLLEVLCETTGMGFAAVARVTDESWTACIVKDDINLGLKRGSQLEVESTLCIDSKRANAPIFIDHASEDPRYCNDPKTKSFNIQSYVSMPIVMASGRYFGNLIAIDSAPARVSDPTVVRMFTRFAALIAMQLAVQIQAEQMQGALRDAQATNELREQFIAVLGHDLRNPLQAIFVTSEVMGRRATDPVLAGMASRIRTNAKRMSTLIDEVLDFARGRLGGGIGVQLNEIDNLNTALHSVVKELQDGQPNREIATNINVARTVRCDLGRIQQVASNLIGNALAHGDPHRPIKVTALSDDHDLIFEVWNEGDPIPPENLGKVFEPFWRPEAAAHPEGLGLGLHICSQIVRAHGGGLSVTSTKETGTTFIARFPLQSLC